MSASRLVARNVDTAGGRTTMRLEPEFWDALDAICARERIHPRTLLARLEGKNRTSAVRVHVLGYFRALAESPR